ncbi:MAG: glycosyltransferase family 4 protein [Elusimicrobiota bacterium]
MRLRNILYVIENEFFGGGERAFAQVINGLNKDRFKCYAACLPPSAGRCSEPFADEINSAAEIVPFDMRSRFDIGNVPRLARIIRNKNIDIVHSQGARADFCSRLAVRSAKSPALICTRAVPLEEYDVCPLKKAAYVALDRLGERYVDKFIVVAEHLRMKLDATRGIPPDKMVMIHNGVDAEAYSCDSRTASAVREEMGVTSESLVIGAVGRLAKEKGLTYLIEAAKIMTSAKEARFLIVGEGGEEESLKAQVRLLGLKDKVVFTGFRKDVRGVLGAIDILTLPSLREGFPMVVLEAMAASKPIIATNIAGVNESVVDGVNGKLVPPKNPKALADAISALLSDGDAAEMMGQAGRRIVSEKFSLRMMIEKHEKLYDELLPEEVPDPCAA